MPTATQYADWMVEYCAKELGAPLDPMGLEKQLYYAQGFSLALRGEQLFPENFEAWKNGPVIHSVWDRYSGSAPIEGKRSKIFGYSLPPLNPNAETGVFLSDVVGFLGLLNAVELSIATHCEEPWLRARKGLGPRDYSKEIISRESMQIYFADLMEEGEEALSAKALLSDIPAPRWGWFYVAGICARRMVNHPLYLRGLSLWGPKSRLGDKSASRPEIDAAVYKPLRKSEAEDVDSFDSIDSFIASLKS